MLSESVLWGCSDGSSSDLSSCCLGEQHCTTTPQSDNSFCFSPCAGPDLIMTSTLALNRHLWFTFQTVETFCCLPLARMRTSHFLSLMQLLRGSQGLKTLNDTLKPAERKMTFQKQLLTFLRPNKLIKMSDIKKITTAWVKKLLHLNL